MAKVNFWDYQISNKICDRTYIGGADAKGFLVKNGDIIYERDAVTVGYLGYKILSDGKMKTPITGVLSSGTATISSVSNISAWSTGETLWCDGLTTGYTISSISTATETLTLSANTTITGTKYLYGCKMAFFGPLTYVTS